MIRYPAGILQAFHRFVKLPYAGIEQFYFAGIVKDIVEFGSEAVIVDTLLAQRCFLIGKYGCIAHFFEGVKNGMGLRTIKIAAEDQVEVGILGGQKFEIFDLRFRLLRFGDGVKSSERKFFTVKIKSGVIRLTVYQLAVLLLQPGFAHQLYAVLLPYKRIALGFVATADSRVADAVVPLRTGLIEGFRQPCYGLRPTRPRHHFHDAGDVGTPDGIGNDTDRRIGFRFSYVLNVPGNDRKVLGIRWAAREEEHECDD